MKKLCYRSSFCVLFLRQKPFFEVKSQNEPIPIAIKIHTHNILCSNLLREKWEGKVTQAHTFFKTNVTFPSFLPFILKYVKKCAQFSECYCYYVQYVFNFSEQKLLFHLFCPLFLGMRKNVLNFQNVVIMFHMFSIFIKIIFECYNLLIDLVPYHQAYNWKKKNMI